MPAPITALVTIRYQWVRIAGLERVLMSLADNRNPSLSGTLVLPVTRYDTSDPSFAELVFSSPGLELEGTIFVPKAEVIAILKTSDPDDLAKVGYRGRISADSGDTSYLIAPPVIRPLDVPAEPDTSDVPGGEIAVPN